jgi:translation initiation factor 2B subunit (eIF-2B alpha/beta/delta family)
MAASTKKNKNSASYSNMINKISNKQNNINKSKAKLNKHMANTAKTVEQYRNKLKNTLEKKGAPLWQKIKTSLTPKLSSIASMASSALKKSPLGKLAKTRKARRY